MVFENLLALWIAIEKKCAPEVAFEYLDNLERGCNSRPKFKWTDEELKSLLRFKDMGLTYKEIGDLYCLNESNIHHRINNYKKRVAEATKINLNDIIA